MSIDKIFDKIEKEGYGLRCTKQIVKDYMKFRDDRYIKMQYNKEEVRMKNDLQLKICDNYAYKKITDMYNL